MRFEPIEWRLSDAARCPVCFGDGLFTRRKDPDPYSEVPDDGEPCWGCDGRGWCYVGRRHPAEDLVFDFVDADEFPCAEVLVF